MIGETPAGVVEGVVFDAVGTLLEPVPSVGATYTEAAARQGVVLDRDEVRRRFYLTLGDDDIDDGRGPLATDEAAERRRWRRIVASVMPEIPDPDRAFRELWDHFGRPDAWRVFADAREALDRLHAAGLAIRIASNFDGRLRGVLDGLPELAPWREPVVISSEVGYRKPHEAFYRAACASLGLPPDRVVCVGDDPENDLEGPRRAGLRAILVDRGARFPGRPDRVAGLAEAAARLLGR